VLAAKLSVCEETTEVSAANPSVRTDLVLQSPAFLFVSAIK